MVVAHTGLATDVAQSAVVEVDLLTATNFGRLQAAELVVIKVLLYRPFTMVVIGCPARSTRISSPVGRRTGGRVSTILSSVDRE